MPPKLDLTRIEDFDPTKEPSGPDLGSILGGGGSGAIAPAPSDEPGAPGGPSETDALLAAIRGGQGTATGAPAPITAVSMPTRGSEQTRGFSQPASSEPDLPDLDNSPLEGV